MASVTSLSPIEKIKRESLGLRGTIQESLAEEITGAISEDDQAVIKFHGMYQQDDRDVREERAEKKLDRLYSFMIRLRLPGGFLTADQWIATHNIAGENSTGVIKITTRQTVQLHGIVKSKIKPTIQAFNRANLDSIATCGDINRNVVCASHPMQSPIHQEIFSYADKISTLLMPKTRAYYEIWLDEEKIHERVDEDPLYEDRYLPRKFKIAIGIPPNNDADVFANDIGLIAIIENKKLIGFNVVVGGGLSTTHGNKETYPRLGTVIGFVNAGDDTLKTVYEILTVQRDYGNRSDRKLARLKYTLDKVGVEWFKEELQKRTKIKLQSEKHYQFSARQDYYGWQKNHLGLWYYTLFVENGRVADEGERRIKSALLKAAETKKVSFRFTCNQNVILSDIKEEDKGLIENILREYGLIQHMNSSSSVRRNSMACVALSTCPLALAEGQRYLPSLISKIEPLLTKHGLQNDDIIIRMTGCPNGCARPYIAEIGFVGTAYGKYNLHLGGDRQGLRLNKLYKESLDEEGILSELDRVFAEYKSKHVADETFGDFANKQYFNNN
jgi:sulfite reductase (NADPH) hemoprotein beta-component